MSTLLDPVRVWECPGGKCTTRARTSTPGATAPHHPCKGRALLSVPMVPLGEKAGVTVVERGDYIGSELVQTDGNGRPVMAVVTERADGQDCTVFAPTAQAQD